MTNKEESIPVSDLLTFQQGLADEVDTLDAHYQQHRDQLSDLDPNRNFALGMIQGKKEALNAFTAFVLARTGEVITPEKFLETDKKD